MGNPHFLSHLRCLRCGRVYGVEEIDYVCGCRPNQGSDLGSLDAMYDYAALRQTVNPGQLLTDPERTIGRWHPLLPIARRESLPAMPVGDTPLLHAGRLGAELALPALYLKDDGRNPSASFKDRASAIAVARAVEGGRKVVATASTGNAAAALAGQAAAAGVPTVIFVPRSAPPAKIAQLLAYGSRVLAVEGNYDDAFDLCIAACDAFGWYNRNTGYNPYMSEGKKTVSYEIGAQLAQIQGHPDTLFAVPDAIFVSVGDGCIIGGVYKGFYDLLQLGWIQRLPRLYGVQSIHSSALANGWRDGLTLPLPVQATTRADSISVDAPRDAIKALRAVKESKGAYVTVTDEAILQAIPRLAARAAIFAEPAGAAALAGLLQAQKEGLVAAHETVVVINTGSGLKDIAAVGEAVGEPRLIPPTLAAVAAALDDFIQQ